MVRTKQTARRDENGNIGGTKAARQKTPGNGGKGKVPRAIKAVKKSVSASGSGGKSDLKKKRRSELQKIKDAKRARKEGKEGKKHRRWKAGTVAEREIKQWQTGKNAVTMCTQKAPIARLMRDLIADQFPTQPYRLAGSSIDAFREALEMATVDLFAYTREITALRGQITAEPKTFRVATKGVLGMDFFKWEKRAGEVSEPRSVPERKAPSEKPKKPKKAKKAAEKAATTTGGGGADEVTDATDEGEMAARRKKATDDESAEEAGSSS